MDKESSFIAVTIVIIVLISMAIIWRRNQKGGKGGGKTDFLYHGAAHGNYPFPEEGCEFCVRMPQDMRMKCCPMRYPIKPVHWY